MTKKYKRPMWTESEDNLLTNIVFKLNPSGLKIPWIEVEKQMLNNFTSGKIPQKRSIKQCRDRWCKYLSKSNSRIWNRSDDLKLVFLNYKQRNNWNLLSNSFENRHFLQIKQRYLYLFKSMFNSLVKSVFGNYSASFPKHVLRKIRSRLLKKRTFIELNEAVIFEEIRKCRENKMFSSEKEFHLALDLFFYKPTQILERYRRL